MKVRFHDARVFRETPAVYFADAWIEGQNGLDVVTHHGFAISPPYSHRVPQFYVHAHQTDYNRVVHGERVFELVYPDGDHYLVHLTPQVGALEIPPGVYHRSISCESGSVLLNHAVRDPDYDETQEFHPRAIDMDEVLREGYMKPASMVGDIERIFALKGEDYDRETA